MAHADRGALVRLAAGELPQAQRERLETHLGDCPQCADMLEQLEATRALLRQGLAAPGPQVDWRRVDEAVQEAVTRELARQHRRPLWPLVLVAAGAAVVLAVVLTPHLRPQPTPAQPLVAGAHTGEEAAVTRVERAEHTQVVRADASTAALARGEALPDGVRLRTARKGLAVLQLPDASRAHLGETAEVQVVRANSDEVALTLERGRLTVQASHVVRRGFVVQSGEVRVHVVGTAFSVWSQGGRVEVAVLEGRVRVETGRGPPQLVGAGERLSTQAHGRISRGGLSVADRAAFRALGLAVPPPAPHARATAALAPFAAPREALPPEPPQPLLEAEARAPSALEELDAAPVVANREQRPFAPDVPSMLEPVPPADGMETPEVVRSQAPLPRTAEEIFLARARDSLQVGRCEAFLLGLEELTEQPGSEVVRGQARFLRARCFEERVMPTEARREYLRYLRDFPTAPHADAARAALSAVQ